MSHDPYRALAERLDALPNGFPPAPDGSELRLLARLFSPEEAALAAALRLTPESAGELAARLGGEEAALAPQLKAMAKRGLIRAERSPRGLLFALLPFVVGIYENQGPVIDAEFARLFEDYYRQAFAQVAFMVPSVHRVIPVNETIRTGMELHPYESAAGIVAGCQAWGVLDCICRKQKALIGEPCGHPVDICMALGQTPGMFDRAPWIRALTQEEAMATLRRAAEAGLVHSVTNSQEGITYICNCCTCGCGVLRGIAELGMANVVARSAFVNQVDPALCQACGLCLDACQFGALALEAAMPLGALAAGETLQVDTARCVGCGVCVPVCPEGALGLVRRPEAEILPPPVTEADWRSARAAARGLDLTPLL